MATSNFRIKKICEWCGKEFEAQKVSTRFCSHRCANFAYKRTIRKKRVQTTESQTQVQKTERIIEDIKEKEYLSFSETGRLLGLSRQAIYTMVKAGHLKASKISSRLSFIRRTDIDTMLQNKPYQYRMPKDTIPITDFYTTNEIKEKFGVKDSWIFHIAKEHNIPRTFNRGKTYWSKKHIDDYFAKKAPDPEIKEWYSTQDMQSCRPGSRISTATITVRKNSSGFRCSMPSPRFPTARVRKVPFLSDVPISPLSVPSKRKFWANWSRASVRVTVS